MVCIFKFLKRRPSEINRQERLREDIPTDGSQIKSVCIRSSFIRAGERALQKMSEKRRKE